MVTKADAVLEVLGDGTRRQIIQILRAGPRPVAGIAARLPVSRPAVSKHLRMMKEAGVVTDRPIGTQRFYELNLDALAVVNTWIDSFWDDALARFKHTAERPRRKGKR